MRLCARYQKIAKIFCPKVDKFNYRDIIRWLTHGYAVELHYVYYVVFHLIATNSNFVKEWRGTESEYNFGGDNK